MKEFKVLPTNPDFRALTNHQIEFIAYSMEKDREELERARRGAIADADYQDYDESWWTAEHDDFVAKRADHDEADIAKQVQDMTKPEDMAKLRARWEASEEADSIIDAGGTTIEEDTVNALMERNLAKVIKDAKALEAKGINKWGDKTEIEMSEERQLEKLSYEKITKEGIDEALEIFNNKESGLAPETYIPSQDDEFYI